MLGGGGQARTTRTENFTTFAQLLIFRIKLKHFRFYTALPYCSQSIQHSLILINSLNENLSRSNCHYDRVVAKFVNSTARIFREMLKAAAGQTNVSREMNFALWSCVLYKLFATTKRERPGKNWEGWLTKMMHPVYCWRKQFKVYLPFSPQSALLLLRCWASEGFGFCVNSRIVSVASICVSWEVGTFITIKSYCEVSGAGT